MFPLRKIVSPGETLEIGFLKISNIISKNMGSMFGNDEGEKTYEYPRDLNLDATRWYFQHYYPHHKCDHLDATFHEGHQGATSIFYRKHPSYVIGARRFNRLQGTIFRDVTFWKEQ